MATPIKSLFPPIEKKTLFVNKQQKSGSRRPTSCIDKEKKLEDRKESDHESIANFKNSFQIHEQIRCPLDHN